MGWLASTIKDAKASRVQPYIDAGLPPPLVKLDAGEYLLDLMHQLGPIRSNGTGLRAADWPEIWPFAQANRLSLEPWEFRLILKMSNAYLSGFNTGKEALSIPPIERGKEYQE